MPIVESPDPGKALHQGDILKGIPLYATSANWADGGQVAASVKCEACLVLSRPCVAAHKNKLVVATVERIQENPPGDTFEQIQSVLSDLRSGIDAPDCFYLGHISSLGVGRYRARLDSLHTIVMPSADRLREALKTHRVGRLSEDFRRDLHTRVFGAFAQLGFDDDGWFSDGDLNWLVSAAETKEAKLQEEIQRAAAAGSSVAKPEKTLQEHQVRLARLKQEQARRKDAVLPAATPAPAPPSASAI